MKNHIWLAAALCMLIPAAAVAQTPAQQEVVVNVNSSRMALAIAPVTGLSGSMSQSINDMLDHTLRLSGLFDVVPQGSFLPAVAGESFDKTNYNMWFASGAQVLVKSQLTRQGNGYLLKLALFDVSGNKQIELVYDKPEMVGENYAPVVYAFVNAVIKYFTGEDGFMGQSLIAVSRSGKGQPSRVVTMTTDGQNIANVVKHSAIQMLPTWGPSGGVLLTSYKSGTPDLYLSQGGVLRIISAQKGMNSGADYCAGNGRIALTLSKDGNAEIYTIDANGKNPVRLTTSTAIDTSPSWSPDCSKIAFVSDRGGNPQIYTMNADGSGVSRVTTVGKYNTNPDWGKNGVIAFSARDESHSLDIYTINADGSDLTRITQQQGKNDKPSWSPDGRYIAFSSTRDGSSRIYISTADGKTQVAATTSGWYENPVWGH